MVEVLELREGLRALAAQPLPVKVAYRIGKALDKVHAEAKHHDAGRQKVAEKYGARDKDNPGQIRVPPERMEEAMKEINELLDIDVELVIEPCVTLEELGDIKVQALDLLRAAPIIKE